LQRPRKKPELIAGRLDGRVPGGYKSRAALRVRPGASHQDENWSESDDRGRSDWRQMTGTRAETPHAAGHEPWKMPAFMTDRRAISIAVVALLLVMAAAIGLAALSAGGAAVADSTTCAGWGSADQSQQRAYAGLYVREHGSLPGGATDVASVEAAINDGCMQAFASDVSDTVTVWQAINRR
jgi:hypothetical protein